MNTAVDKFEQFSIPRGRWIRPDLLVPMFGINPEQARKYRERGLWLEGKQWRKDPVGRVVYHPTAIEDWFEGKL